MSHAGEKGVTGVKGSHWVDLAPDICRQRMVIEGTLHNPFNPVDMTVYCKEISTVLDMTPVSNPKTSFTEEYGWCCFMHWKESGMHIYSWDNRSPKFFSIDIYTCKSFDPQHVANYTEEFFGENLIKLTYKE
ncbi:hypothetical protein CL634_08685 [bacterium]|nr:hypothetical protein [bacterium]